MRSFVYDQPAQRVIFGPGTIASLRDEVTRLGARRLVIISTPYELRFAEDAATRLGDLTAGIFSDVSAQHVPVVSYDRLIRNSDVSIYISYDNVKVGELQAQYLFDRAPKGNYVLIGGAPTDNNARSLCNQRPRTANTKLRRVLSQFRNKGTASTPKKATRTGSRRIERLVVINVSPLAA